ILEETGDLVPEGERALEDIGIQSRAGRAAYEKHHLLVQQLRKWFASKGINIDELTVKLSVDEHSWVHRRFKWNEFWKEFRLKHPNADVSEIMDKLQGLIKEAGLEGIPIESYK